MDLIKLNNEISSLRPLAIQSRVRVIHFLTKKAEQFRKRNGPEDKKATYEKKAQRLMDEALIDKVLKPDEIAKFALQFDSSLRDKVLNDVSIPLSAKAFARIASHPCIVEKVEEFRNKHPDWNKWLEKSLEKLGTGSRFGAKMKNGRVKAHLQQRQRIEEAIDTIRRAQMQWLHNVGKNKVEVENRKDSIGKNVEGDDNGENSESSDSESNKETFATDAKPNSDCGDNSDSESSEDAAPTISVPSKIKTSTNSIKNKKGDKISEDIVKKSKPVFYEEIDNNDSGSEEEIDSDDRKALKTGTDKKKHKSVTDKTFQNKQVDLGKKEMSRESDSDSERSEDSESENSTDNESENMENDEFRDTDESGSQNESENNGEIDEKTAKKLLKKARRKEKAIIPRSREVEVCKFSELLKKEQIRKSDDSDGFGDSDDGGKTTKSPEKGVDPFFMTRNNDFLRLATAKREAAPEEPVREGPKWGIEGSENWTGTRRERRARARQIMGVPDPEGFCRRRGPPKLSSPAFPGRRENMREGHPLPSVKNGPAVPDQPEELHPSWAAKRKMNIASVSFQGKKVKFDDSD